MEQIKLGAKKIGDGIGQKAKEVKLNIDKKA